MMEQVTAKEDRIEFDVLHAPFYRRSTILVAIDLLGQILFHKTPAGLLAGAIVEVEAYLGEKDPACHASRGRTERNRMLWGEAGRAYVFVSYGKYFCLNVVTERPYVAGCVLIRAIEPICGIETMEANRHSHDVTILTSGPGRLTQALGIGLGHNGRDLSKGDLLVLHNPAVFQTVVTSRIGISKAAEEPLRFYIDGNRFVSKSSSRIATFFQGTPEAVKEAFRDGRIRVALSIEGFNTRPQL